MGAIIISDAQSIKNKQEKDSIPFVDDLKSCIDPVRERDPEGWDDDEEGEEEEDLNNNNNNSNGFGSRRGYIEYKLSLVNQLLERLGISW